MEWQHPELLFVGIPVVIAWCGIVIYSGIRNRRLRERFAESQMMNRLAPHSSPLRGRIVLLLQALAVIACMLALAGPQYGEVAQTVYAKGNDLYVLLDVSRSMLANDVPPSRLERAKADIASLSNRLHGERIGLIAFAGQATVQCPLTVDYENFRAVVANIDTTSAPRGGTAIGDAIRKAMEIFSVDRGNDRAILLITDGDDQNSSPLDAAKIAAEANVPITIIGLGDAHEGARIPASANSRGFVEYEGEQVWTKLDSKLLEEMARITGGAYIPAGIQSFDLSTLYRSFLSRSERGETEDQTVVVKANQFQWFLAVGLLAMIGSLTVPRTSRPSGVARSVGVARSERSDGRGGPSYTQQSPPRPSYLRDVPPDSGPDVSPEIATDTRARRPGHVVGVLLLLLGGAEISFANDPSANWFNQGCEAQRLGDSSEAIKNYGLATMSLDRRIASSAQFNLGTLYVEQLEKNLLKERDDQERDHESSYRAAIEEKGSRAIEAFRNALELDPNLSAARSNLELLKQWLSKVQREWHQADLESKVAELGSLDLLDQIYQSQRELHLEAEKLFDFRQLQPHRLLGRRQSELIEELALLPRRIEEEAGKEVSERLGLERIIDEMRRNAASLDRFQASKGASHRENALEQLANLWNELSSFDAALSKGIHDQSKLVSQIDGGSINKEEIEEWIRETMLNRRLVSSLVGKAKRELAELPESESKKESESEERSSRRIGLEKGIELAPLAAKEMEASLTALETNAPQKAFQHAEEAKRILEEIARSMPPPENDSESNESQPKESSSENQSGDSQSNESKSENSDSSSSEPNNSDSSNSEKPTKSEDSPNSESPKEPESSKEDASEEKPSSKESGEEEVKEQPTEANPSDSEGEKKEEKGEQKEAASQKEGEKEDTGSEGAGSEEAGVEKNRLKDGTVVEEGVLSKDKLEQLLRRVREREAAKRLRDKRLREQSYGRPRVEKDW